MIDRRRHGANVAIFWHYKQWCSGNFSLVGTLALHYLGGGGA